MRNRLLLLLSLLTLFFPIWLLPGLGAGGHIALLAAFAGAAWASAWAAERLAPGKEADAAPGGEGLLASFPPGFLLLAAIAVLLRAPGANLPVIPVLDAIDHQGTPAVVWASIASTPVRTAAGAAVAWTGVVLLFLLRARLARLAERFGAGAFLLGILSSLAILTAWNLPEFPGHGFLHAALADERLRHLQRYPPLGKMLAVGGYALFGIREAVVPGIQTAFVIAAAWVLGRWSSRASGGTGLPASAGWLFAPVFLSPMILGHIEAGTILLLAATLHLALRVIEENRRADYENYLAAFFCGIYYKELHFVAFPIVACFALLAERPLRERIRLGVVLLVPPLIPGVLYLFGSRIFLAPARVAWEAIANPSTLAPTVSSLDWGFGSLLGILGLAGLVLLLAARPSLRARAAAAWLLVGILFVWTGNAWSFVRVGAVFLPPAALGLGAIFAGGRRREKIGVAAILVVSIAAMRPAASDLVTIHNYRSHYLPYEEAIHAIPDDAVVYAPSICEPSWFYLAKARRLGRLRYERKLWYRQGEGATPTIDGLLDEADRIGATHLLLPVPYHPSYRTPHEVLVEDHPVWKKQNAGWPGGEWDVGTLPPDLADFLDAPRVPWLLAARFRFGEGELVLLARNTSMDSTFHETHDPPLNAMDRVLPTGSGPLPPAENHFPADFTPFLAGFNETKSLTLVNPDRVNVIRYGETKIIEPDRAWVDRLMGTLARWPDHRYGSVKGCYAVPPQVGVTFERGDDSLILEFNMECRMVWEPGRLYGHGDFDPVFSDYKVLFREAFPSDRMLDSLSDTDGRWLWRVFPYSRRNPADWNERWRRKWKSESIVPPEPSCGTLHWRSSQTPVARRNQRPLNPSRR